MSHIRKCLFFLLAISFFISVQSELKADETRSFTLYCLPQDIYSYTDVIKKENVDTIMTLSMANTPVFIVSQDNSSTDTTTLTTSTTGTENRPKNMAVRFYIRALK